MSGIITTGMKRCPDRTPEVPEGESVMGEARTSARDRIIEAYLGLLAKDPHRKVTVSAVAKAAGCNRDTFYYHFQSIDDAAFSAVARTFGKSALDYARERGLVS